MISLVLDWQCYNALVSSHTNIMAGHDALVSSRAQQQWVRTPSAPPSTPPKLPLE